MQMKSQKTRSVRKSLLVPVVVFILPFIVAEVILRLTTDNYYSHMSVIVDEIPRGIRLTWPMEKTFNAAGLYEDGGETRFRITEKRNIYPGYENAGQNLILFFGGSTTESPMVKEGARYPDLIGKSLGYYPMNYGNSGNASIESSINLEYLLDKYDFRPKIIFLQAGWNDYGIFMKSGSAKAISEIEELIDVRNGSKDTEFVKKRINSYIRKSYVIAHIYMAMKENFKDSYLENLINDARANSLIPAVSDEEFEAFIRSSGFVSFLENRKITYGRFIKTAKEQGAKVVVYTEPTGYVEGYKSYAGPEVRLFPTTLDGKRMSLEQARRVQELISGTTREAAHEGNALLIDLDRLFPRRDTSALIYDAFHYSEEGSRLIAELTVQGIRNSGFLEDDSWYE